jgi:AcrR family transcriptional regulator
MSGPAKLAPDPDVRCAIVEAAAQSMRDQGVRGLNVAAVLERAHLSTRAFYRHFQSKEQLVAAVYSEMARDETQRLRTKMANAACPVEAVAAWIDGRLDVAFDEDAEIRLRPPPWAGEQSTAFSSSEMVSPAYHAILEPLIEQLQRGLELGEFQAIVPTTAAKSIDGAVWAVAQQQRATHHRGRSEVREGALRFCLRGLGVAPEMVEHVAGHYEAAG